MASPYRIPARALEGSLSPIPAQFVASSMLALFAGTAVRFAKEPTPTHIGADFAVFLLIILGYSTFRADSWRRD
jgi:hypothetical protein